MVRVSVTRLHDGGSGVRILVESTNFSVLQNVETEYEAHPAPYSVGTGDCFPGGKATEA